mmetsp:Transcript_13302/g.42376  ORF Transcript_13302/g.42376 Transcript_13302/m.42376 type:complete len:211 (-) Transcript_13302:133-765(-)
MLDLVLELAQLLDGAGLKSLIKLDHRVSRRDSRVHDVGRYVAKGVHAVVGEPLDALRGEEVGGNAPEGNAGEATVGGSGAERELGRATEAVRKTSSEPRTCWEVELEDLRRVVEEELKVLGGYLAVGVTVEDARVVPFEFAPVDFHVSKVRKRLEGHETAAEENAGDLAALAQRIASGPAAESPERYLGAGGQEALNEVRRGLVVLRPRR